jgi:hypothetical protein
MLEGLLGSQDGERVLLFLAERNQGYGKEIADFWNTRIQGVQRQLEKFESGGLLISETVGRTRVYRWNPRWPFQEELLALLRKAIGFLPEADRDRLQLDRRRPRRRGKPL